MNERTAANDPWQRLNLAGKGALVLAGTQITIGLFSMGPALPSLAQGFAETPNAAGLVKMIGAIVAPAFALASLFVGRLVARYDVRAVWLVSLILFQIAGIGPALCTGLWQIMAFRILLGVAVAGAFTAAMAGVARIPESQRHIMLGLMSFFGGGVAILVFPVVGTLAAESWQKAFLIHTLILPLIVLVFFLPRRAVRQLADAPKRVAPSGGLLAGVPLTLLVAALVSGWGMTASSLYSSFFLNSIGIGDAATVGKVLGAMAMCSLAGSGSYGFVQRFVGTRGMVFLALALAGVACFVISLAHGVPGAIVGLGMLGASLAIFGAAGYGAAIEEVGATGNAPAAMGVMNFVLYGPQLLFPPLATAIDTRSNPAMVFVMLSACFAAALVLLLIRRKPKVAANLSI